MAAIAGLLLAPITFVHANMGFIGLKAFPAAVVGGFGSLPGAHRRRADHRHRRIARRASTCPRASRTSRAYIVVLVMLMVKPNGLFGEKLRKKV